MRRLCTTLHMLAALSCACAPAPPAVGPAPPASRAPEAEAPAPPASVADPVEPHAAPAPPPTPAAPARLAQASLDALSARLGALIKTRLVGVRHSVLVVDLTTGQELFASNADAPLVLASTTKLFTTAAALSLLGESHRPTTRLFARLEGGKPGHAAELRLIGDHDPSWTKLLREDPRAPLKELARAAREKGITRVGAVVVAGEPLFEPERFKELDPKAQRVKVAERLSVALREAGIKTGKAVADESDRVPEAMAEVASFEGEPLTVWIEPINQMSHNGLADALSRHLGHVKGSAASYEQGTKAVLSWWREAERPPIELVDGSGLSRGNKGSARAVVALLSAMQRSAQAATFTRSLGVAGEAGTIKGRMTGELTRGRVRGKTGTLKDVVALSGYIDHAGHGRTFAFSILLNEVRDIAGARGVEDALVGEIAAWR